MNVICKSHDHFGRTIRQALEKPEYEKRPIGCPRISFINCLPSRLHFNVWIQPSISFMGATNSHLSYRKLIMPTTYLYCVAFHVYIVHQTNGPRGRRPGPTLAGRSVGAGRRCWEVGSGQVTGVRASVSPVRCGPHSAAGTCTAGRPANNSTLSGRESRPPLFPGPAAVYGPAKYSWTEWHRAARHGMARLDSAWHDLAQYGTARDRPEWPWCDDACHRKTEWSAGREENDTIRKRKNRQETVSQGRQRCSAGLSYLTTGSSLALSATENGAN